MWKPPASSTAAFSTRAAQGEGAAAALLRDARCRLSRAGQPRQSAKAFFDHFCALVQDYNAPAMGEELKAKGLPAGRFGIIPDPGRRRAAAARRCRVGSAKSTEPAGRIVEGECAGEADRGSHEVVLHVPDVEEVARLLSAVLRQGSRSCALGERRAVRDLRHAPRYRDRRGRQKSRA